MTQLVSGREKEPIVMLGYGEAGSGKSSFAVGAPNPVFIGPERNKELSCLKFPRTESQDQLLNYLKEIGIKHMIYLWNCPIQKLKKEELCNLV